MIKKVKHHFIPQFYMKYWSKDCNNIFVYRLLVSNEKVPLWSKRSIKGIGYYPNLYTGVINKNVSYEFENWFDREFEAPSKLVFDKIRYGKKLKNSDYKILTKYAFAQHVRTPAFLLKNHPIWVETIQNYLSNLNISNEKILKPKIHKNKDSLSDLIPLKSELTSNNDLEVSYSVGKGIWLFAMKHHLTSTICHLPIYNWSILQAPNNFYWPTSDNPVVLVNYFNEENYNFGGGWNLKGTQIILPITPMHLLTTFIGRKYPSYINVDLKTAKIIRKVIIDNAYQIVLSIKSDNNIPIVKQRIVDKVKFKRVQKDWNEWLVDILKLEKDLKNIK